MLARRIPLSNSLVHATHPLLLTLVAVAALACEEGTATDAAREVPRAVAPRAALGSDVALAQGDTTPPRTQAIPLPVNQVFNGGGVAFRINQTGTGPNGNFTITNASSAATALHAQSNGSGFAVRAIMSGGGQAGQFHTTNQLNAAPTLEAKQFGMGSAATFAINNANNWSSTVDISSSSDRDAPALRVAHTGILGFAAHLESRADNAAGSTLVVSQLGTGSAATFISSGQPLSARAALEAMTDRGVAGSFTTTSGAGGGALEAHSTCFQCPAGVFTVNSTSHILPALVVSTNGGIDSWAASFGHAGSGGGVQITTNGGPGLQVVGGSKNAVVRTRDGSRALYTEESTEVWFTDYGFARLANRQVRVRLDPKFSETVSLGEPYHVFVQPYGRAEIYVTNRNRSGFDVVLKDGEPNVEFSYRVVAKRLGFESKRLERAPWADRALIAKRSGKQQRVAMQ